MVCLVCTSFTSIAFLTCSLMLHDNWPSQDILVFDLQINRLLLEDDTALANRKSEYYSIIMEFRAFLSDSKDVLDEATTMKLLER